MPLELERLYNNTISHNGSYDKDSHKIFHKCPSRQADHVPPFVGRGHWTRRRQAVRIRRKWMKDGSFSPPDRPVVRPYPNPGSAGLFQRRS